MTTENEQFNALNSALSGEDFSLAGMFDLMEQSNAGIIRMIARDKDGNPIKGVILLGDRGTIEDVEKALDDLDEQWDRLADEES